MTAPRVIVVQGDPATRALIDGALGRRQDLRLITCSDASQARRALAAGPARLLVLDLALAGGAGPALLHELLAAPAGGGRPARLAVLAAASPPGIVDALPPPGVWRVLEAPVSLLALAGCIDEALAAPGAAQADTAEPADGPAGEAAAIAAYFAGQAALYKRFKAGCLTQFAADLRAGDAALASADAPALRRLAHALKSVLRSLGHPADGASALALERAAAVEPPDWAVLAAGWHALGAALRRLRTAAGLGD